MPSTNGDPFLSVWTYEMVSFSREVQRLANTLNLIAGWSLVGMIGLTCADVILRLFRRPILGTYEIVGFLGAVVAAFAMAHTTLKRGHVAVEVLVSRFSPRVQVVIYLITHLFSIGLFALISWESIRYGNDFRTGGEVSLTLRMPFYPVLYGIAFSSTVVCLVLVVDCWRVIVRAAQPWHGWAE